MSAGLRAADAHAARGDLATARQLYASSAARNVPGAHERLCHATSMLNRHEEALACCATALKLLPTSSFLHQLDGQVALAVGKYERSASSYWHASELSPAEADVALNHGLALAAAHRPADASLRLQRAVALSPRCTACYSELGRVLELLCWRGTRGRRR